MPGEEKGCDPVPNDHRGRGRTKTEWAMGPVCHKCRNTQVAQYVAEMAVLVPGTSGTNMDLS